MLCFLDDCQAGYYCTLRSNNSAPSDGVTGDICPEGNYCPVGSPAPVPCDDGKQNSLTLAQIYKISRQKTEYLVKSALERLTLRRQDGLENKVV